MIRFNNLWITSMHNLDEYWTVSQAARFLGVSASTLRNWDRQGRLKPARHPINRYRLYLKKDLEQILRNVEKKGQRT